jgi:putative transposase
MASEHGDVLRESVARMVAEPIEAEVAAQIGAELGERAPGSGRRSATATGGDAGTPASAKSSCRSPKLRQGSYFRSAPEPRKALRASARRRRPGGLRQRREQAQVDRLVEQMGLRGMSKDQVSRPCRGLDEQVAAFRDARRWRAPTPTCGWTRRSSASASRAASGRSVWVLAYAVQESGRREVLGLDVGEAETESF